MQKNSHIYLLLLIFIITSELSSQTKPSLLILTGFALPGNTFGGELISENQNGYIFINPEFIKNNYSVSTGVSISGVLKFALENRGILKGEVTGSYTNFNTFRRSYLGTTLLNNIEAAISFENSFSATTLALGIEVSPIPDSRINPFINASVSMNILSLSLTSNDQVEVIFSDAFRMGILTNAGLNVRLNQEYSLCLSAGYHFSNLLFKGGSSSFDERVSFSRDNVSINDEEGSFYTNLSNPDTSPVLVKGTSKEINWLNINIGVNILLGK